MIDAFGGLRSKARTLSGPNDDPTKLPNWNYDGSSTGQAPGKDSEVIVYPQAIFKDPFKRCKSCVIPTHLLVSQFLQTRDVMQLRFSATLMLLLKYPGPRTLFTKEERFLLNRRVPDLASATSIVISQVVEFMVIVNI